jgi:hypothetical protein
MRETTGHLYGPTTPEIPQTPHNVSNAVTRRPSRCVTTRLQRVRCRITLYGIKAASGGADVVGLRCFLACPAVWLRLLRAA